MIKPRNKNEDEPICNKIEQMSNKTPKITEEMDKTTKEIAEDKKISEFDQKNESNRTTRKAKEQQKIAEATGDETHDPRTVSCSKNCYKRSTEDINRPWKNNKQLNFKGYENNRK